MTLTNFRDYKPAKDILRDYIFATVDVTTSRWWKKTTVSRRISRQYAGTWFFVDDGELTPGFQAETLERAHLAQRAAA